MVDFDKILKERLTLLQPEVSSSVSDFARKIGMKQATVNNYFIDNRKISADFLCCILNSIPNVSADWLMRGEGSMLRSTKEPINDSQIEEFNELKQKHYELEKSVENLYKIFKSINIEND